MGGAEEPPRQGACHLTNVPSEIFNIFTNYIDIVSLKSLLLTCHSLASSLRPTLIQRDIDSGTYNSLAWACFFNQVGLGRACLELGADPNAAFYRQLREDGDETRLPFYQRLYYPDLYEERPHLKESAHPVFPTNTVFGVPLFLESGCASRSALMVAVYRDHVDMAKLLLKFGAAVIEPRPDVNPDRYLIGHPSHPGRRFYHENALCHVRSVSMAKALFEAGAARDINYAGVSGFTPLEMVLATGSRYKVGVRVDLTEPELHALVKLFLDNGARTRRQNLTAGSLLGAIATDYLGIVKLILDHCNFNPADGFEDHGNALALVLNVNQECFNDSTALPLWTQTRILNMMLAAGLSPHYEVPGLGPVLQFVLKNQPNERYFIRSLQTVINSASDINHTGPTFLSPLATAVASTGGRIDVEDDNVVTLVRAGAGLHHPSLWDGGFTPLMFATGDYVPVRVFGNLVRFGSDLGAVRKVSPKGPLMSVLQCLLAGFPEPHFEWEDEMDAFSYRRGVQDVQLVTDYDISDTGPDPWRENRRRDKFLVFIEGGIRGAHFYTDKARHVLNWALENLYHKDLEWAVEALLPHYHATKMPGDTESPIWVLFSRARVQNYLQFGVMTQTLRIAEKLLAYGVTITTDDKEQGQTILHRIAQLPRGKPTMFNLRQATQGGKRLDFGQTRLSSQAMRWEEGFSSADTPQFRSATHPWTQLPRAKHEERYVDARHHVIAQMLTLFMRHGVDFYARDGHGETAFETFVTPQALDILNRIPADLRDAGKEEAILEAKVGALQREAEEQRAGRSEGSKKEEDKDSDMHDAVWA